MHLSRGLPLGDFDQNILTLSFVTAQNDTYPKKIQKTFAEFKKILLAESKTTIKSKDKLYGFMPAVWRTDTPNKKEENALTRHCLLLDFDQDPKDITQITAALNDFVYFGWTTHSHLLPEKGKRYRIVIPFNETPTKPEWREYKLRLVLWFEKLGFGSQNKVDPSCLTFGQIGFFPAINPATNAPVEFYINDKLPAKILSLNDLPELTEEEKRINSSPLVIDWQPTSEEIKTLIDLLRTKSQLISIDANPTVENKGVNRKTIAAALQSINASFGDFAMLDSVMRKHDSNTTTEAAWFQANQLRVKHAGVLFKLLAKGERRLVGLVTAQAMSLMNKKPWTRTEHVDYLSRESYGTAKRVLVNADMGTGKNYTWTQRSNSAIDKVIVLSPLRSIVGQQGSTNTIFDPSNTTFTYDQSRNIQKAIEAGKINPRNTTLVVDECHNLLLAQYRLEALINVESLLRIPFKQIIFQSATVSVDDFDGFFEFDEALRFKKNTPVDLRYCRINSVEFNAADVILNIVDYSIGIKKKILVLWNNKQKIIESRGVLKSAGFISEVVSADLMKINDSEAFRLANSVDYEMDGVQILFGTTSLVEGVSIMDEIDVGTVIVIGHEPPQYVKQICGRFRKAKRVDCWHVCLSDEERITDPNAWLKEQRWLVSLRASIAKGLNEGLPEYNAADHAAMLRTHSTTKGLSEYAQANGLVFDEAKNKYADTGFGQLFVNAEMAKTEFYNNSEIAYQIMEQEGFVSFEVPSGLMLKSKGEIKDTINRIKKEKQNKIKVSRAESAAPLISVLNQINEPITPEQIKLFLDMEEQTNPNDQLQTELIGVVVMAATQHPNRDYLIRLTNDLVNKKKKLGDVEIELRSEIAKSGVIQYLKSKYPKGTRLTQSDMAGVVKEVVEFHLNQMTSTTSLTREQAWEHLSKTKAFYKRVKSGDIKMSNSTVEVEMSTPIKWLNAIGFEMEGVTARLPGVGLRKVGVAK